MLPQWGAESYTARGSSSDCVVVIPSPVRSSREIHTRAPPRRPKSDETYSAYGGRHSCRQGRTAAEERKQGTSQWQGEARTEDDGAEQQQQQAERFQRSNGPSAHLRSSRWAAACEQTLRAAHSLHGGTVGEMRMRRKGCWAIERPKLWPFVFFFFLAF